MWEKTEMAVFLLWQTRNRSSKEGIMPYRIYRRYSYKSNKSSLRTFNYSVASEVSN